MRLIRAIAAGSVAMVCCADASGQTFLKAKELNALIVGNTLHGRNLQRGDAQKSFFDPSGKFMLEMSGRLITGTWRIQQDGTFCVTMVGAESCARIRKNSDGTYTRVVDGVARNAWTKVTKGNALDVTGPPGEPVTFQSLTFPVAVGLPLRPPVSEGAQTLVTGHLSIPGSGTVPAVILTHGCSGISATETGWAAALNQSGIATLVVDNFGPRNILETCTGREFMHATSAVVDAYRALDFLAGNPRIDPGRIAIMGASLGGQHALWASQVRFKERYGNGARKFAAYLALYPAGCITRLEAEDQVDGGPIRIFHGAADDWTRVGPCKEYVERLRQAGRDAVLIEYAAAYHSFDNPALSPPQRLPELRHPAGCTFVERDGRVVDPTTGGGVSSSSCWSRGVTVGYNAEAHKKAMEDVRGILSALFGLN